MPSVVFLRGINVGGNKSFKPSALAKALSEHDVVNIGAAGTFVVRSRINQTDLRRAIEKQLPVDAEIIIRPAKEIINLVEADPFAKRKSGDGIKHYATVLARTPRADAPKPPITTPDGSNWQVRIFDRRERFALSEHRRVGKKLVYPNEVVEKQLGVPATTRNWNTIQKIYAALT